MIKGVNKQVLEVTNTENPYFEKIIFFVKPEYQNGHAEKLKKRRNYMPQRLRSLRNHAKRAGKSAISSVRGFCALARAWR